MFSLITHCILCSVLVEGNVCLMNTELDIITMTIKHHCISRYIYSDVLMVGNCVKPGLVQDSSNTLILSGIVCVCL